jgi:hypothetical protein
MDTIENLDEICYNDIDNTFLSTVIERIEVDKRDTKNSRLQPNFKIYFLGVG